MDIKELLKFDIVQIIIIIAIAFILTKCVNLIFKKIYKKKEKTIYLTFANGFINTLIIITTIIRVGSYSKTLTDFSNTILMSSSLLVVVLGFVFQEGLSNIVHGFIILFFKPFEIGDRIQVTIDNTQISGLVESINLRHTKIINVADNAPQIVPNSKLDISTIKNFSNKKDVNKYPIKVDITYEDAQNKEIREKAKKIISNSILEHPLVVDLREDKEKDLFVKVEFLDSFVRLTCWITTKSFEDNFKACSEITESILDKFSENNIDFGFHTTYLIGDLNVSTNDLSNPDYLKKMAQGITTNILNKKSKGKNQKQSE